MVELVVNVEVFLRRLKTLYDRWKAERAGPWQGADVLAVPHGTPSNDISYKKSASLHMWLFGYEIPDTVMVFTPSSIEVVASKKKVAFLEPLVEPLQSRMGIKLALFVKDKSSDGKEEVAKILPSLRAASAVGVFAKDKHDGPLVATFFEALGDSKTADVSAAAAEVMAVKDEAEQKLVRKSAFLASSVVANFVQPRVEEVAASGKRVRHKALGQEIEEACQNPAAKAKIKLKADAVDVAYPPVVQSGGTFDLRMIVPCDDRFLHPWCVTVSVGTRYQSYCANCARTFFVNAPAKAQTQYQALLSALTALCEALRPGALLKDVYAAAIDALKASPHPELAELLPKNLGSLTGIELREASHVIGAGCDARVEPNCAYVVNLMASPLVNEEAPEGPERTYALQVSDTVLTKDGAAAELLTSFSKRDWKDLTYLMDREEMARDQGVDSGDEEGERAFAIGRDALRAARKDDVQQRQRELAEEKTKDTIDRLRAAGEKMGRGKAGKAVRTTKSIVSYRDMAEMPKSQAMVIQVDHRRESLLLPIYGVLVPFHIATVKSITYSQEGELHSIRVIFNTPGSFAAEGFQPAADFPHAIYVKELSYRSKDAGHASRVVQEAKALQKNVRSRDKERAERATLVSQEKMVTMRVPRAKLSDVWARPALGGGRGRKAPGVLEVHQNGFRYSSPRTQEVVDVMFSNVKHAFFQPAQNEHIALVHLHLFDPIMVNKKKTNDVQFFTEVVDAVQTLDGARSNAYDPDEIEDEQRERERKNRINKDFERFCKQLQDVWSREFPKLDLEWQMPYRKLMFEGVPFKENVNCLPTMKCLVELTSMPFLVVDLDEAEIVSLERVGISSLRNFDIVVVFKDFTRPVQHIHSVPAKKLEVVKQWLTSTGIPFFENKHNMRWDMILKEITKDPAAFEEVGGWAGFLDAQGGSDDEDDGEPSDDDFQPSGSSEEEESDDESSDYITSEGEDSGSEELGSDEESGKDWDELEKEAADADAEAGSDDDEEERRLKRKREAMSKKGGGGSGKGSGGGKSGGKGGPAKGSGGPVKKAKR